MADTALFSSFRRPAAPLATPPLDEAAVVVVENKAPNGSNAPELTGETVAVVDVPPAPALQLDEHQTADNAHNGQSSWSAQSIEVASDQLGLAHPDVIALYAGLRSSAPILLEALTAGIYRPIGFRPAPWSGFAYNRPRATSIGFAAGTRILTARGEVEVERLVPGDAAMALRGPALLPISSIGRTAAAAAPILIEPGALGPDVPRRSLCIGPQQAIFLKPDPVAAHTLVNGTTIRKSETADAELFLIDVGRSEIILAEGVAVSTINSASKRG